ncbi:MAG TPA: hypothetical protein VK465_00975 [Fibrobacteria bacterium]|nr:hypothetical protein [Fibrobacteria bacterium]
MKIKNIALLGAVALLAACNQTESTDSSSATADGPKNETSSNGALTKGATEFDRADAPLAKVTSTPWIGLIPTGDPAKANCPDGMSSIRFDDEDKSNRNDFHVNGQDKSGRNFSFGGLAHSSSPRRAGGNSVITYCNKQVNALPTLSHDYAVISASDVCPANSYRFYKRWDNEDAGNHNAASGDITPGWTDRSGSASGMYFCFVPAGSGSSWNSLFDDHFLFSNAALGNRASFYQDDEDNNNNNQYSSTNATYTGRMQQLISGGSNTRLNVASASPAVSYDGGTGNGCGTGGQICSYNSQGVPVCRAMSEAVDWLIIASNYLCWY